MSNRPMPIRSVAILVGVSVFGYTLFQTTIQFSGLLASEQGTTSLPNQTELVVAQTPQQRMNLDRLEELDFNAWNNRNWTLFRELHTPDVFVVDFSGNTTKGIDQHVEWAKAAVTFSPDLKVSAHPIEIAAGNWTVTTGTLPGNATMLTLAYWEDGRIAEEYLFSN